MINVFSSLKYVKTKLKKAILEQIVEDCEKLLHLDKEYISNMKGCKTEGSKNIICKINSYLKRFSAPFCIDLVDKKVKVILRNYNPQSYIKSTPFLSEGEQHLLCLSYFFSYASQNENFTCPIQNCKKKDQK